LRVPAVCTPALDPDAAIRSWKPKPEETTPIEPTIELSSTQISSAAQASQ